VQEQIQAMTKERKPMSISQNLIHLHETIADLARQAGRDPADIHLMAVSKYQPEENITEALNAGHRLFGENRVQEAQTRWGARKVLYPDLRLHLIGPLQTNKAAEAVALFDVIEKKKKKKLARVLADEMKKQGVQRPCFIQVNTGEEPQKSGIFPRALAAFCNYCTVECGLEVLGLMCIPPEDEPPALHFALLKKQAQVLGLEHLSMGMSGDFEKAIPFGATYIRIGTGIFGVRENAVTK